MHDMLHFQVDRINFIFIENARSRRTRTLLATKVIHVIVIFRHRKCALQDDAGTAWQVSATFIVLLYLQQS
jgi:hypothetical protein